MSKPEDKPAHAPTSLGRRSFLFAGTGTGVAALAAVAAVKTPEAPPAEALAERLPAPLLGVTPFQADGDAAGAAAGLRLPE